MQGDPRDPQALGTPAFSLALLAEPVQQRVQWEQLLDCGPNSDSQRALVSSN